MSGKACGRQHRTSSAAAGTTATAGLAEAVFWAFGAAPIDWRFAAETDGSSGVANTNDI